MNTSLIAWAALAAISPLGEYARHQVEFTEPGNIELEQSTVAVVTHASAHFDPLRLTKPAVDAVTAKMKRRGFPVIYMHDRHNDNNPPWLYLYNDWKPTAFIESQIGFYDLDMRNIRHVVCMGGFFWRCEKNTVSDSIRNWRRDAPQHDLRITQVVDGIFDVAEAVIPPYRHRIRTYQADVLWKQFPNASMTVEQIIELIDDDELAIEFLTRQLPELPEGINVSLDFFGRHIQIVDANQSPDEKVPHLLIAYRASDDFLSRDSQHASRRKVTAALGYFVTWPQTLGSYLQREFQAGRDLRSIVARPLAALDTHLATAVQHRRTKTSR